MINKNIPEFLGNLSGVLNYIETADARGWAVDILEKISEEAKKVSDELKPKKECSCGKVNVCTDFEVDELTLDDQRLLNFYSRKLAYYLNENGYENSKLSKAQVQSLRSVIENWKDK
jgi:hypothetical protein